MSFPLFRRATRHLPRLLAAVAVLGCLLMMGLPSPVQATDRADLEQVGKLFRRIGCDIACEQFVCPRIISFRLGDWNPVVGVAAETHAKVIGLDLVVGRAVGRLAGDLTATGAGPLGEAAGSGIGPAAEVADHLRLRESADPKAPVVGRPRIAVLNDGAARKPRF